MAVIISNIICIIHITLVIFMTITLSNTNNPCPSNQIQAASITILTCTEFPIINPLRQISDSNSSIYNLKRVSAYRALVVKFKLLVHQGHHRQQAVNLINRNQVVT